MEKLTKEMVEEVIEKARAKCNDFSGIKYCEWWAENTGIENVKKLMVNIEWGDWKHEHAYADWLVEETAKENGMRILNQWDELTDENGSDCYSALHHYVIVKA